jgi:hypothetical protein
LQVNTVVKRTLGHALEHLSISVGTSVVAQNSNKDKQNLENKGEKA